ncbi:MAG: hypothetical protein DELT_01665 [Desulfovibrio sp.]
MPVTLHVYGEDIVVDDACCLYNDLRVKFSSLASSAANTFREKYVEYGNLDEFVNNGVRDGMAIVSSIIQNNIIDELVSKYKILDLDVDSFSSNYIGSDFPFLEAAGTINDQYYEMVLKAEELDEYRTRRRQNRPKASYGFIASGSGTSIGQARSLAKHHETFDNVTSNIAHGVFNLGAKAVTMIGDSIKKTSIYNSTDTIMSLERGMYNSIFMLHFAYFDLLGKFGKVQKIELVEDLFNGEDRSKAILNNVVKIDPTEATHIFHQIILKNPYSIKLYETFLGFLGNSSGELDQVANFFGVPLDPIKNKMLSQCYDSLEAKAHASEQNAQQAKAEYGELQKKIGSTPESEEQTKKIDDLLEKYDIEARTVDEMLFSTREDAEKARVELAAIHELLGKYDYAHSEPDAHDALASLKKFTGFPAVRDKFIEKIEQLLHDFDLEARTARFRGIELVFDSREQAQKAREDSLRVEPLFEKFLSLPRINSEFIASIEADKSVMPEVVTAYKSMADDCIASHSDFVTSMETQSPKKVIIKAVIGLIIAIWFSCVSIYAIATSGITFKFAIVLVVALAGLFSTINSIKAYAAYKKSLKIIRPDMG